MNAQKLEKNIEKPLKTFVPREVNRIDRPINGKVIDAETGEGLPGASIIVKGTSQGTTTDINGDFTLNVPDENTVLEISYVGFITVELAVGSQSQVTIN